MEAERGRFESVLGRVSGMDVLEVAYTDYDRVKIGLDYDKEKDRETVEEFADYYELPVEW